MNLYLTSFFSQVKNNLNSSSYVLSYVLLDVYISPTAVLYVMLMCQISLSCDLLLLDTQELHFHTARIVQDLDYIMFGRKRRQIIK